MSILIERRMYMNKKNFTIEMNMKSLKLKLTCYISIILLVLMSKNHLDDKVDIGMVTNNAVHKLMDRLDFGTLQYSLGDIKLQEKISNRLMHIIASLLEHDYSKEISNDEKLNIILEKYGLTYEQFEVVTACTIAEAKGEGTCYIDAYAVINTIYNRCLSEKWINEVDNYMGEGTGMNLYYQVVMPGQFSPIASEKYINYLGINEGEGYQAIIDFLYSEEPLHTQLSFNCYGQEEEGKIQYVDGGNWYYNELEEDEKLDLNESAKYLEYVNYR